MAEQIEQIKNKNLSFSGRCALVVDDEATSSLILTSMLETCALTVQTAKTAVEMQSLLSTSQFDIIFLDYKLGKTDGLELLGKIVGEYPRARIIMITAHGSIDLAVQAMRRGASGFITKPFEEDKIRREIDRMLTPGKRLKASMPSYRAETGIIGASPAIARIHEQIDRMKDVDTTVLIIGESGTGKELVARALHDRSTRSKEKFEAINCAAIPENLLESELFGHKRGAFTDAKSDRKGLFEVCSNGTLFLDEIGELPLNLQSKLLRVLQEKVIIPLGSSQSIKVNTRVVAATNRNLQWLVKEGRFRRDLYYRLSILQIETPPLRDRPEDIATLTNYFIETITDKFARCVKPPTNELLARLTSYDWPGNVRELQNSLERAIILSEDGTLAIDDIFAHPEITDQDDFSSDVSCIKDLTQAKDEFEKRYIEKLLVATNGNVSRASKIAGRIRTDMYRLFTKYNIDPTVYKS
jgi:DNA-binding NtrC family response regulator